MNKKFEYTKYHDEIKNNYCKDKGIELLRLPYWDFKDDTYKNKINKLIFK